ncbi:MAG TPA: FG-GAP-like repeat-containing protein [Pyrinomonadaceae bacterium]|jgi:hypothetical protein
MMIPRFFQLLNRFGSSSASYRLGCVVALVVVFSLHLPAQAQNIRLRSQMDPSSVASNWQYADLYGEGNVAVLGTYDARGAYIFDISNPDKPVLASWYNPSPAQQMLEALVRNNIGYFGSGNSGGVHVVNLTNPYSPTLITTITSTNGGGYNTIHEILLDGNYLYETDSRTPTVKVINISNPAAPFFVRNIVTTDPRFIHAVHIANGRLFTSGWGGKTEIYDISNVATQAPLIGTVLAGNNAHSTWTSTDGNFLYSARETIDGDLRVYNISNPANPLLVKSISAASFGLNAICPHNPVVVGNLLFVAWYQAGLQVFDISNPANPVRVGQFDTFSNAFSRAEASAALASDPWDMVCGSNSLLRGVPNSYDGNWAVYPFLGLNKILLGDLAGGLIIVDASDVLNASRNKVANFDGDRQTDFSVFRPSSGTWYVERSSSGGTVFTAQQWGLGTDKPVPGDYDGDGKTDIAVFRPSDGYWYILQSSNNSFRAEQWGQSSDVPVPGDYDSDGRTDIAVFRPNQGTWYIKQSTSGFRAQPWGSSTDKPVPGDYDGDGKTDLAMWRPSNGTWYVLQSTSGIWLAQQWGRSTDKPLLGDFDGDARTDIAVYRPSEGTWYVLRSSNNSFSAQQFGNDSDVPVQADYDADGKTDIAVYRPSEGTWYVLGSFDGAFSGKQFGMSEDTPAPSILYSP